MGSLGGRLHATPFATTTTPKQMFYKVICHDKIANIEFESADCALYILHEQECGIMRQNEMKPLPRLLRHWTSCSDGLAGRRRTSPSVSAESRGAAL